MNLKLNLSKFNFIYLSQSKSLPFSFPPIMISDLTIYPSSTIRCLGFLLDSSLSFNPQILSVSSSCFFHLRHIRQISSYLDDAFLKILVCFLVLSRLDYCNFLYFNLPKSILYPLTKAFNSAARLVSHTPKFSYISPSLVDLHWLPPHFRFSFKICSFMYKISHSASPSYLSNLLLPPKRADLRSSTRSQLFIISLSHSYAKSAFSFSGPLLKNSLPPNLKSSSYPTFLKNLKTSSSSLLQSAFEQTVKGAIQIINYYYYSINNLGLLLPIQLLGHVQQSTWI